MSQKPVARWGVMVLTAGFVLLPIAVLLVWGTGELLGAMGDVIGRVVLRRVALAGGLFWAIDLLGLLLVLALNSLGDDESP